MQTGVADPNPYDGIEAGKLNLWTYDHYHASTHGYYLEALSIFGSLTGRDPRSLGDNECSAFELGLSRAAGQGAAAGRVRSARGGRRREGGADGSRTSQSIPDAAAPRSSHDEMPPTLRPGYLATRPSAF